MIVQEEFYYNSADKIHKIHGVRWYDEEREETGDYKGIVQIMHGMSEHIKRYEEFAVYLVERGYLVVGHDHLGHGKSIQNKEEQGYFHESSSPVLLQDIRHLYKIMHKKHQKLPYIMMGHSMGSYLLRQYLCRYPGGLEGAIIMGTGSQPRIAVRGGVALASLIYRRKGGMYRSPLLHNLTFGTFNKTVKSPRTTSDWLCSNEDAVDQYLSDEYCGFPFTVNGHYHLFKGMLDLKKKNLMKMDKNLKVFFISGEDDPVGSMGKGVLREARRFQKIGMKSVDCKLYPNARHEILNEKNRQEVYADIYHWLENL